jgi:ribosomal protein L7/L12
MTEILPVVIAIVIASGIVVSVLARVAELRRRLDRLSRIEGKVDALMRHFNLRFDPRDGVPPDVLAALRAGQKIEAIKRYRQATGADLAEAKDAVEEAARRGV